MKAHKKRAPQRMPCIIIRQHRISFGITKCGDPTSKGGFETQPVRRVDSLIISFGDKISIKTENFFNAGLHGLKLLSVNQDFEIFALSVSASAAARHAQALKSNSSNQISFDPHFFRAERLRQRTGQFQLIMVLLRRVWLCRAQWHDNAKASCDAGAGRDNHDRAHLDHFRGLEPCLIVANQNLPEVGGKLNWHSSLLRAVDFCWQQNADNKNLLAFRENGHIVWEGAQTPTAVVVRHRDPEAPLRRGWDNTRPARGIVPQFCSCLSPRRQAVPGPSPQRDYRHALNTAFTPAGRVSGQRASVLPHPGGRPHSARIRCPAGPERGHRAHDDRHPCGIPRRLLPQVPACRTLHDRSAPRGSGFFVPAVTVGRRTAAVQRRLNGPSCNFPHNNTAGVRRWKGAS